MDLLIQSKLATGYVKSPFKTELNKVMETGSTPTTWPFFGVCHALWGKTPKYVGLMGSLDSDRLRSANGVLGSEPINEGIKEMEN